MKRASKQQVRQAILAFNQRVRALTPETPQSEIDDLNKMSKEIDKLQGTALIPLSNLKRK